MFSWPVITRTRTRIWPEGSHAVRGELGVLRTRVRFRQDGRQLLVTQADEWSLRSLEERAGRELAMVQRMAAEKPKRPAPAEAAASLAVPSCCPPPI